MDEKLLKLLDLGKLDESKQTEIKDKFESIIEVKVDEKVKDKLDEKEKTMKEGLTKLYEEKFEAYKDDITEKFSNFIDEILEQEMVLDPKIIEFARKGELYEDLIEQFKTRLAIDEDILDKEVKDILREARDEIKSLKDEINTKIEESLTLKIENDKLSIGKYITEKVKGLPIDDAEKVASLLEDEKDTESIDKKFDIICETILNEKKDDEDDDEDEDDDDKKKKKKKKKKDDDEDEDEDLEESKKSSLIEHWANSLKEDK